MGGIYRAIESLVEIAEKLGVSFIYNCPVSEIKTDGSRVTGVVVQGGREFTADIFVGNADLPYIYRKLLPESREAQAMENKRYTCSTIMFYWGVDKRYHQIAHHNVFLGGDYRDSFDRIFNDHDLPSEPSFYVHAPTRTDPSAAPEGQDTLYVLVPVGHLDAGSRQDWNGRVQQARASVLKRLAQDMDISDLDQHLKFEIVYQPETWQEKFNLEKGAAFGLSHNFLQVGYLRPQNRHARYKNLYFAGASTHPGTGLPIVLLSAKLTSQRILQELPVLAAEQISSASRAAIRAGPYDS
jgi:phytoene desaturase